MKNLLIFLLIIMAMPVKSQETFQSLFDLGQKEVENQNYQKAIEYYDRALTTTTEDSSKMMWTASVASVCASHINDDKLIIKYNNIAIDYGSQDQFMMDQQLELAAKYKDNNTTEKVLYAARNIDGKYKKYTSKLVSFYFKNQKYPETLNAAEEILSIDPENVNALDYKGLALTQSGNNEEALETFKTALSISPDDLNANIQAGMIIFNKAKSMFDTANKNYEKIKAPTPLDYHHYKQEVTKAKPYYEECLPYLQKYNAVKNQSSVTDLINEAKSQIEDLVNLKMQ